MSVIIELNCYLFIYSGLSQQSQTSGFDSGKQLIHLSFAKLLRLQQRRFRQNH